MHDDDHEPLPVPEHGALYWSGERLDLPQTRIHSMRLARLGEDDAALVFVGSDRKLWSRRIRKAFSAWPPEVGDAVSHPHGGFNMNPMGLMGWADGTFSVNTSAGWIFGAAGEPGTRCALPQPGFSGAAGGVYTFSGDGREKRLAYRATRTEEAHVTDVGPLPAKVETMAGCVTEGGRLMLLLRLLSGPGEARAPFIPERIAPRAKAQWRDPLQSRASVLLNIRQRALLAWFASLCYPR